MGGPRSLCEEGPGSAYQLLPAHPLPASFHFLPNIPEPQAAIVSRRLCLEVWVPGLPALPVVTRPLFPAQNNGTSLLDVTLLGQLISSMCLLSAANTGCSLTIFKLFLIIQVPQVEKFYHTDKQKFKKITKSHLLCYTGDLFGGHAFQLCVYIHRT